MLYNVSLFSSTSRLCERSVDRFNVEQKVHCFIELSIGAVQAAVCAWRTSETLPIDAAQHNRIQTTSYWLWLAIEEFSVRKNLFSFWKMFLPHFIYGWVLGVAAVHQAARVPVAVDTRNEQNCSCEKLNFRGIILLTMNIFWELTRKFILI